MTIDVAQFLGATFTEPNSTKREVIPPMDSVVAIIDKVDLESFPGVKDPTKVYLKLKLQYNVDDQGLRTKMGRNKVIQFDDFLLDLTDGGALNFAKGFNVRLGKLREACGQNVAGQPWGFKHLEGQAVRLKIGQELYKGDPQSTVEAVTKV